MRIQQIQLKNFKRFTDLTLQNIPENAKLVLLIGSNGSGKSSVFDGFEYFSNPYRMLPKSSNLDFIKVPNEEHLITISTYEHGERGFTDRSFYGRTSFRQVPRLTRTNLGASSLNIPYDSDRSPSFIDRDKRFENDLEHIFGKLLKEFFRTEQDKSEIKKNVIEPINDSLERIFGTQNGTKLRLLEIIPPIEGKIAEINFQKGESLFHYNYLSAGEKEIFNILINLVARKEYYTDTIYFFDEIDLHLNTKLQYNLLKEIVENWIPGQSQLWTASHSLGFIQYAKENDNAVIFDFDDYDFDHPKVLQPEPKEKSDIYEIAVSRDILPELFKNFQIFFVENEDRQYYASLNIHDTIFVSERNRDSVFHKVRHGNFKGIVDRDFLTDEDIELLNNQYSSLKILNFYCVENYLYHPDNMKEYCIHKGIQFDRENYIKEIAAEKQRVQDSIIIKVATVRQAYPYFKEVGMEKSPYKKRFTPDAENFTQSNSIAGCLKSDIFDDYYKIFSMKEYCKTLPQRQNISPVGLSKTNWFRTQIEVLIAD